MSQLSRVRKSIVPADGDSWAAIAGRELPGVAEAEAVSSLQSWNLHVFTRAYLRTGAVDKPILPSDIIFVEPPLARA